MNLGGALMRLISERAELRKFTVEGQRNRGCTVREYGVIMYEDKSGEGDCNWKEEMRR